MGDLRTYGTLIGPVKGHSVLPTDIDEQVCMAAVTTIEAFQMRLLTMKLQQTTAMRLLTVISLSSMNS